MDFHLIGLEATTRDGRRLSEAQWARRRAELGRLARPLLASRRRGALAGAASAVLLAASLLLSGQGGGVGHAP